MPDNFKQFKVIRKNGNAQIISNDIEAMEMAKALEASGEKDYKIEPYTPPRPADMTDRFAGAAIGGITGAIGGAKGGIPGALVGGGVGATTGFALPPTSKGDMAALAFGNLTGGGVGNIVQKTAAKVPGWLSPAVRAGAGIAEAEAGTAIQTGIDSGKPQGFNPVSLQGAAAGLIPLAANSVSKQVDNTYGANNQRLRQAIPGLEAHLTNSNLNTQTQQASKLGKITKWAADKGNKAKDLVTASSEVELEPYRELIKSFDGDRATIQQQIDAFKQSPTPGVFSAAQNLEKRVQLEKQLSTLNTDVDSLNLDLARAEHAAMANRIAVERGKKAQTKTAGMLDKKAELATEVSKFQLSKENWEQKYLEEAEAIMTDKKLLPAQQNQQLKLLRNRYAQVYQGFDKQIAAARVDSKLLSENLLRAKRKLSAPEQNLITNEKFKSKTKLEIAGKKQQMNPIEKELDVPEVNKSIDYFRNAFKDKSVLPRSIKTLVDSPDVDSFVNAVKTMKTDELNEAMKFLPTAQQDTFRKELGEAVMFDFYARSFDPKTGMFSNTEQYINKFGVPNLEFFTGSPDAQKRFSELTSAVMKGAAQERGNLAERITASISASTIRGFAYSGMTALFGLSAYHRGGGGVIGTLAAGGVGLLAVGIPKLISTAMKNEKLAKEFIKFVDSGGTITYSQLPYLSAYLKKEAQPVTEEELKDKNSLLNDMAEKLPKDVPAIPPPSENKPSPFGAANPQINQQGPISPAPAMPQQQPQQPNQQP
jgi:hypothetical protein